MGQEVSHSHFSREEREEFIVHLEKETHLLKQKMQAGEFSSHAPMGGFEVEACLIDKQQRPAPVNNAFFDVFDNPLATSELAKFNIELNNTPLSLKGKALYEFENELNAVFKAANHSAAKLDANILLIGILPTTTPDDFCLENMSTMKRYKALNESIVKARDNKPLEIEIEGENHFKLTKHTVMIEAATTSFQIHLQTPLEKAHHYYNAAILASAPIMAIAANSPLLFGKRLWHETRIPLFEQSVDTGIGKRRVSFGSGYADASMSECFDENLTDFPVLLPMLFASKAEKFKHLCLHNGVIWRWNRPLIGFDEDGTPHVRVEHRILPAGPTISDMIANATFFYGLAQSLMQQLANEQGKSSKMPFATAKDNFYQAAQYGLNAKLEWQNKNFQGEKLQNLICEELIPLAADGLTDLGLNANSIKHFLDIIEARTSNGQTGAIWQLDHLDHVNNDLQQMTADYLQRQHSGDPVHTWTHD